MSSLLPLPPNAGQQQAGGHEGHDEHGTDERPLRIVVGVQRRPKLANPIGILQKVIQLCCLHSVRQGDGVPAGGGFAVAFDSIG